MLAFLLFLVIVWIALGIIGFVVKGLIWLFIIAVIAFLLTVAFGGSHASRRRRSRRW